MNYQAPFAICAQNGTDDSIRRIGALTKRPNLSRLRKLARSVRRFDRLVLIDSLGRRMETITTAGGWMRAR